MNNEFYNDLGYLGYTMRLKRLSDNIIHSGRKLYQDLEMDIEPNWFIVFRSLKGGKQLTVTEIAEQVGLSHPSLVAIVQAMSKKGFIESTRHPEDSRKRSLSLSKKGVKQMEVYEKIWSAGSEAMQSALEGLKAMEHLSALEDMFESRDFRARVLKRMAEDIRIEPATDEGLKAFEILNLEWLEKYFYVEDYDRRVLGHAKKYIIDKGGFIFNAILMNKVVGTVALIPRGKGIFELSKMAVTERFQGLRIGLKLMEHCIAFAREKGTQTLFLDSNTILTPAITLYKKVGFKEIPVPEDTPYERCNIRMEIKFQ